MGFRVRLFGCCGIEGGKAVRRSNDGEAAVSARPKRRAALTPAKRHAARPRGPQLEASLRRLPGRCLDSVPLCVEVPVFAAPRAVWPVRLLLVRLRFIAPSTSRLSTYMFSCCSCLYSMIILLRSCFYSACDSIYPACCLLMLSLNLLLRRKFVLTGLSKCCFYFLDSLISSETMRAFFCVGGGGGGGGSGGIAAGCTSGGGGGGRGNDGKPGKPIALGLAFTGGGPSLACTGCCPDISCGWCFQNGV